MQSLFYFALSSIKDNQRIQTLIQLYILLYNAEVLIDPILTFVTILSVHPMHTIPDVMKLHNMGTDYWVYWVSWVGEPDSCLPIACTSQYRSLEIL